LGIAAAAAIAACGGSSHHNAGVNATKPKATPATLVSQTFSASNAVQSGKLDVTATITLDGVKQLSGQPITLHVSGPFARGADNKVSTALTMTLGIASKNINLAVDEVNGAAYVGIGGTFYKLPASATRPPAGATGAVARLKGLFTSLGINPKTWLTNPHIVGGTTKVGGVDTDHLTAQVDVPKMIGDLGKVASQLGGSAASALPTTSLNQLGSAITSAQLDVYTGVADHIIRQIHVAVAFKAPASLATSAGGLTGGSIDFVVTLTDLNQPQTITAPANAQPFTAAALGGLLGGLGVGANGGGLFSSTSTSSS
jgi:hypothetical protein